MESRDLRRVASQSGGDRPGWTGLTARALNRLSRVLHRWVGLGLFVYLAWMGASGVLLNHPRLISAVTVPEWMVPPQYRISNWSRGALRSLVSVPGRPDQLIGAGRLGVWRSSDGGRSFTSFNEGLGPLYDRKASQVLLLEDDGDTLMLLASRSGLFSRRFGDGGWDRVPLGGHHPLMKLVLVHDRLLAFTDSGVSVSLARPTQLGFEPVELRRAPTSSRVSLIGALFALHSGEAWGLGGRLLYDAAGIVLVVLSVSAAITWIYGKRWAFLRRVKRRARGAVRILFRYHLKLGIWFVAVLLVIGASGMFMRPPLLGLIAGSTLPRWAYPAPLSVNPWQHKIQNATHDRTTGRLLVQATDGIWEGPPDLSGDFRRIRLPAPVFPMGATVFESDVAGGLTVGSFAGLFRVGRDGDAVDLMSGEPSRSGGGIRPGQHLVTGLLRLPDGTSFVATHRGGLLNPDGSPAFGRLPMPPLSGDGSGMPLWNFLFELHNGRIFRDVIGGWYVLIVPLGGFLLVLLSATGTWDWARPRLRKWRVEDPSSRMQVPE